MSNDYTLSSLLRDTTSQSYAQGVRSFVGTRLTLPAALFVSDSGSPTSTSVNTVRTWSMPDAALTRVSTSFDYPAQWIGKLVNIDLTFANLAASTGNVRWQALLNYFPTVGASQLSPPTLSATAAASSTNQSATTVRIGSSVDVGYWNAATFPSIAVQRLGADAADTLANACALVAVTISTV